MTQPTRCPECKTTFQVSPQQLTKRGGLVRCGHCQSIFNAKKHLLSIKEEPSKNEGQQINSEEPDLEKNSLVSSRLSSANFATPKRPAPTKKTPPEWQTRKPSPLSVFPSSITKEKSEARKEPIATQKEKPAPESKTPALPPDWSKLPEINSEPYIESKAAPEQPEEHNLFPDDTTVSHASLSQNKLTETEFTSEQKNKHSVEVDTESLNAEALNEAPQRAQDKSDYVSQHNDLPPLDLYEQPPQPASRSLQLAIPLLCLTLCLQFAYWYRSALVIGIPEFKVVYKMLKIDLPVPRQINLIAIEGTSLQSDPERAMLTLLTTFTNRASFSQQWPMLELTLTDSEEEPICRRLFHAAEYLSAKQHQKVLNPIQEVGIRLHFDLPETIPFGYKVSLFYPNNSKNTNADLSNPKNK